MQSTTHSRSKSSIISEIIECRGWIFYDGRCPICRRGARRLGPIVITRGFRLAPLQRRWVQALLKTRVHPIPDELLLLLPDDRVLGGVDAFTHLAQRVWWAKPLALLASVPGLRWLARRFYDWFAANRFGISRVCGGNGCRVGS